MALKGCIPNFGNSFTYSEINDAQALAFFGKWVILCRKFTGRARPC